MSRIHVLIAGLILLAPVAAAAQSETARMQRVPVTIALVDAPALGSDFEIVRRMAAEPLDIIVFHGQPTAAALSDAVRSLLLARATQGDTTPSEGMVRVRAHENSSGRRQPYPWADRVVADLTRATPQILNGIGRARAVQIWLPPQRRPAATPISP